MTKFLSWLYVTLKTSFYNGNQPRRSKPLQRLITYYWLYFSFKNSFHNGYNGNQRHRWKPLQRLITLSWLYFTYKNSFRNSSNRDCNGKLTANVANN
jgi:hypothetical protein